MDTANIANLSTSLSQTKLAQQHQTAMLKMSNDAIKEQGREAMQLVQSTAPDAQQGGGLDVYA